MKRIVLGVTGSAACFKAVAICSELVQMGHEVHPVLTPSATRLITPLQFSCIAGRRALHDEWNPVDPAGMDHIELARAADLLLVVPATANFLGQAAQALAPTLLGSLVLAMEREKPRLFVPAMNPQMWRNPGVARNVATLEGDGWLRIGPISGLTACGEEGEGRMAEPVDILAEIEPLLSDGA